MADLSVEYAGLKLRNPLVVASGPPGATVSRIEDAAKNGAGAIITKMILLHVPPRSYSRFYLTEKNPMTGMLYTPMDKRLNLQEGIALIKSGKQVTDVPIIANVMGPGRKTADWVELGQALADAGADALELNLSCPNISFAAKLEAVDSGIEEMGAVAGSDPEITYEIVKAMVDNIKIPIIPKLTPEAPDIIAVADACRRAGAPAISAINGYSSLPGVDIENDGRPLHPGMGTQAFGGFVGAPLRYLAYRHVAHLAMTFPELQILGGGGIYNTRHTIEMLMLGAQTVSYCSVLMLKGMGTLAKIHEGLIEYMDRKGYRTLADFRGKGLEYLKPSEVAVLNDVRAQLAEDKCNRCGACLQLCHCDALTKGEQGAVLLDASKCVGCGVCYRICPKDAFSMVG